MENFSKIISFDDHLMDDLLTAGEISKTQEMINFLFVGEAGYKLWKKEFKYFFSKTTNKISFSQYFPKI